MSDTPALQNFLSAYFHQDWAMEHDSADAVVTYYLGSEADAEIVAVRDDLAAVSAEELEEATDVLTPNESEFAALLASHCDDDIDADAVVRTDDARLHRLCRALLPGGTVVVTLGAAGAFVSHRDDALHGDPQACYRCPAIRVETVDTTGAGDAFNGALAASLARAPSASFAAHVAFACRYAGEATRRPGAAAAMPHLSAGT